jgi:predicted dehydrogenase/nucleoside-diphosphate-sugar epimerase
MTSTTLESNPPVDLREPNQNGVRTGQLRVALVGCGAISEQMHLPVLAGRKDLQIAAIVERNSERAKKFASGYNITQVFADAAELSRDTIDAAIIATPPSHHAPCTIDLVRKGIHVLVEKPMAMNLADAEAMVAEADRAGVVLSVGFFRRLYPSIRLMKSLIDSGWAGRPLKFLVEGGGMYNWSAATLANMRRETAGGGVLIDFGSHMVDLLFALFDEPAEVLQYVDNALGGIEADCTIDLRMRHGSEPIEGRIELARTRRLGCMIRVECERATLEFEAGERFQVKVVPKGLALSDPVTGKPHSVAFDAYWQGEVRDESWYATFGRQFDDWTLAIRTGKEPVLSGRSALATSRLMDACYAHPLPMQEPWVWNGIKDSGATTPTDSATSKVEANGHGQAVAATTRRRTERILVTGASGFIGCRVVELLRLRENCEVRAVVHNPGNASRLSRLDVEMVQADLGSAAGVRELVKGCDRVIHCAIGTEWGEPRKIYEVTVEGTRRLAEAAVAEKSKRFVHVSTMAVYGDENVFTGVLDEQTPVEPIRGSVYAETKAAAEQAVLNLVPRGLSAAIFRPARVYGPYSRIFIIRPLQAIGGGYFAWLGNPDVPADMVYVDNVAESLLAAAFADESNVTGEVFNIGAGDDFTWQDFYAYFSDQLQIDLSVTPVMRPHSSQSNSAFGHLLSFPTDFARGVGTVVTSPEFKSLGRRVLSTNPLGTLPRKALERFPSLERNVRRLVKADGTLPIYEPEKESAGDTVHMGSAGAMLSNEKLRQRLGFVPPVSRAAALQLTLEWVRHARIV